MLTYKKLEQTIRVRFGGRLYVGSHHEDGMACINEACRAAAGLPWGDEPIDMPDLRPFNDGDWPTEEARAAAMLKLAMAYIGWDSWPAARKSACVSAIALRTITDILPIVLRDVGQTDIANACATATDLDAADSAARWAACWAARSAACSAACSAADSVLNIALQIWLDAARKTRGVK